MVHTDKVKAALAVSVLANILLGAVVMDSLAFGSIQKNSPEDVLQEYVNLEASKNRVYSDIPKAVPILQEMLENATKEFSAVLSGQLSPELERSMLFYYFVNTVKYAGDPHILDYVEFIRVPSETIEEGGDCEDQALALWPGIQYINEKHGIGAEYYLVVVKFKEGGGHAFLAVKYKDGYEFYDPTMKFATNYMYMQEYKIINYARAKEYLTMKRYPLKEAARLYEEKEGEIAAVKVYDLKTFKIDLKETAEFAAAFLM